MSTWLLKKNMPLNNSWGGVQLYSIFLTPTNHSKLHKNTSPPFVWQENSIIQLLYNNRCSNVTENRNVTVFLPQFCPIITKMLSQPAEWCNVPIFFFSIFAWKVSQSYRKWSEKTCLGVWFLKFYFIWPLGVKKRSIFHDFWCVSSKKSRFSPFFSGENAKKNFQHTQNMFFQSN